MFLRGSTPVILVNSPEAVEGLYVKYNKYFDKAARPQRLFNDIAGKGIVFMESGEIWRERRKHISVAFYKDKMIAMIDAINGVAYDKV